MLASDVCRRVDIGTRMPLCETEAIVLRTYRLGEGDKIASLFTRQFGRLRGVARGAQRPKGRYGVTLEPLSYIRLWIFERENRDLLRINSAELLESFFDMQKDYRLQLATQYLVEVSERFLPEREVNERAFRLLLAVLRAVARSGEVNRPLVYFDYWVLRLAGFLPDLDRCLECGRPFGGEPGFYAAGSAGLKCAGCGSVGASSKVSTRALASVRSACQSSLDHWLVGEKAPPGIREARLWFEELIELHSEKKLLTRGPLAEQV